MSFEVTPISAAPSARPSAAGAAAEPPAAERRAAPADAVGHDGPSEQEAEEHAYSLALRILGSRAMASGRLRERLLAREVDRASADAAIQRVVEAGYLDDRDFAADAVQRLRERKMLGDAALRQELMKLGVGRDDADAALEAAPADDPFELALAAARDRAGRLRSLDRETAERRLLAFLQRRGHGGSAASRAVRTALDEQASSRRTVSFS